MGFSKWLKKLLGRKKEKVQNDVSIHVGNKKDRKRWSFGKSDKNFNQLSEENAERLRSYYMENDQEQSRHAIAVAEATAAAADAAAAAALAAAAVVKLTSGRKPSFNNSRETWAAVKIQTVFRGFLARKAHRALRGLVKLQALVRGYLVRKQAAATFHMMQSLIRIPATVRAQKARSLLNKDPRFQPESRPRKSMERSDDYRNEIMTSIHSRRMSGSIDNIINVSEDSPKIVEVDTCRQKSTKSRRINVSISDSCEDMMSLSPPSSQIPSYLPVPDFPNTQEFDWWITGDEYKFATAQSTPRFASNPSCTDRGFGVLTPAKSVGGSNFYRPSSNFPSYMANTQSSIAKVRSQSAPKQRPEPGSKRRLSLREIAESRSSFTGIRMHRATSHDQLRNFKHSIMGRLDRSAEFIIDADRDYLHRRW